MEGVEASMATILLNTTAPAASLVGLPTKLRLKIYEHLLPTARTSKPLVWYGSTSRWIRAQPKGYSELAAIARVCRIFATEPGRLVLAKAALCFHYLETLYFQSRASRAIFSALVGNNVRKIELHYAARPGCPTAYAEATEGLLQDLDYGAKLEEIYLHFECDYGPIGLETLEPFLTVLGRLQCSGEVKLAWTVTDRWMFCDARPFERAMNTLMDKLEA